jgi:hypothetical protein
VYLVRSIWNGNELLYGLKEEGYCIIMDNYFCSIPLFKDLISKGIYTTGIIRSNCIELLSYLKNTKT